MHNRFATPDLAAAHRARQGAKLAARISLRLPRLNLLGWALALLLACHGLTAAAAEHRVALVIGNAAYEGSPLRNPVNDARAMAAKLKELDFKVILKENLKTKQIGAVLREFRSALNPGDQAVFFYAGHGLQVKGVNYLPAVDAEINSEDDVPLQSISVAALLDALDESKAGVKLVFLDACRNNPYARSFRSAASGLSKIGAAPSGTLISFATRPGSVAADGEGKNGLYTSQLLKHIGTADMPIEQVLKRVAADVESASTGKQEPWIEGSIKGDFYFRWTGQGTQVASLRPEPTQPQRSAAQLEEDTWKAAVEENSEAGYEEYLKEYGKGKHAGQAKIALAKLKKEAQSAPAASTTAPAPAAAAVDDADSALWKAVETGNNREDYEAYLSQYPRGKYVALAKARLKKLDEAAQQERARQAEEKAQQEEQAWHEAEQANSEEGYRKYQSDYPKGRYVALVAGRIKKLQAEASNAQPGRAFKDCPDCPEMVTIPSGSFEMGSNENDSEKPVHRVSVRSFAIGKTEVTQGQWQSVMGSNPSYFKNCGADCPVESVSWNDAQEFIQKLNAKTGKKYRLPSEAEWEYACRAGGKPTYCGSDNLDAVAWYSDNSGHATHVKASKQANAWGLYDMSGNVWEWLEDCWHDNYNGAPNEGSAWTSGQCDRRVLRGGSWKLKPQFARAADRFWIEPAGRSSFIGFRLARMLP